MTDWYYAENGQRLGPIDADTLRARHLAGTLAPATLAWREGMADWRPIAELAEELGLPAAAPVQAEPLSPYAAPNAPATLHVAPVHAGDVVQAGFWKRFAAMFIDNLVMFLVSMVIIVALLGLSGGMAALNPQALANDMAAGTIGATFIVGVYLLPFLAQAAYFSWMHASASQATLGKMAVGIKVVRVNGEAISLGRSIGRFCANFFLHLFTCGVATLVSAFTTGLTERKQSLHDMMVDTLVVDKWAFTAHPERQRRELGTVTWVIISLAVLVIVAYLGFLIFAIGLAAMADR